jgi:hypothetical protein
LRLSPLAVLPLDDQGADIAHFDWPPVSRRQVLLFPTCACDELTPPLRRTPPGPRTGSSLAEDAPRRCVIVPGLGCCLGFGVIKSLSTRQQWFTHVRLLVAYLTRSRRAFSATLTTSALDRRSLRWFGIPACTANPEDLPPSQIEHVLLWRSSTSSSLHFQDTPPPGSHGSRRESLPSPGSSHQTAGQ